jgi:hypothetical protein
MTPRKTERYFIDETEIEDQPLFITNTMVITNEKYEKENNVKIL